jgi:hypothetical protein
MIPSAVDGLQYGRASAVGRVEIVKEAAAREAYEVALIHG